MKSFKTKKFKNIRFSLIRYFSYCHHRLSLSTIQQFKVFCLWIFRESSWQRNIRKKTATLIRQGYKAIRLALQIAVDEWCSFRALNLQFKDFEKIHWLYPTSNDCKTTRTRMAHCTINRWRKCNDVWKIAKAKIIFLQI